MNTTRLHKVIAILFLLPVAAGVSIGAAQTPTFTPVAPVRAFEVVAEHPHDTSAFTEGLIYLDGDLYEGTGYEGSSDLRQVDLATGTVLRSDRLDGKYFGEGVTILGDKIYQLTYRSEIGFVYDLSTFEELGVFTYEGEGWGLTTDGVSLIMSNGTDQITYRDPETFEVLKSIAVRDGDQPVDDLNELEYIDGVIWANVWKTNCIARIDPESGQVIDWLDLTSQQQQAASEGDQIDVLNGIAWNEDAGTALVTGKYWPLLFEIKLTSET